MNNVHMLQELQRRAMKPGQGLKSVILSDFLKRRLRNGLDPSLLVFSHGLRRIFRHNKQSEMKCWFYMSNVEN